MIEKGTVLDGKYEILKQIGKGGTAVVYLAMDNKINKQWAIKRVKKSTTDHNNQIVYQNFITESNLMKRLDHHALPRIVDILDDGDEISVVMDYIEGKSLSKVIKNHGAQPENLVIKWSKVLCDVLRYLHSQDPPIIYRDMKPGNVMLRPDGNVMVIDFGIAREYKVESSNDTIPMATPGFAPPEQTTGVCKTDARTDIYSLGVTMFNLLTAIDPRTTQDYDIKKYNPSYSGGLQKIILKCTERMPENRYQSCEELMFALEHYNEFDDNYRKKLKRKLTSFCIMGGLAVVMLGCGIGFSAYAHYTNSQDYDNLIGIAATSDVSERIENYKEAVAIYPDRTDAYLLLLDAYTEGDEAQAFSADNSNAFIAVFNQYSSNIDKESNDWLELNYRIGLSYFYSYVDANGEENHRARFTRAYEYFNTVVSSENEKYKNFKTAKSYYTTCSYYKNFVTSTSNVNEPTKEEVEALLQSFTDCMDNVDDYDASNSGNTKLTMYTEIVNMLTSNANTFKQADVEKQSVLDVLNAVYDKTKGLAVSQEASVTMQNDIVNNYESNISKIENAYAAVGGE